MDEDKPTPTKRQLATQDRRRHIIEAAAACFVEQGFHQSSIRDIAKRAQISLGNLYNHFESKTALIAEIASLEAEDLDQIRGILEGDGDRQGVIDAFVTAYFNYVSLPENAVLTAEITVEAMRNPHIVEAYSENRQRIIDGVIASLSKDRVCFPEQADELAKTLLDLVESAAGRVAFSAETTKSATLVHLRSVVRRLLSGR